MHETRTTRKGSVAFERCSTWAPDFVEAIRRHHTGSRGAPPGKKMAWRIYETCSHQADHLVGWIGLGEPSFKLAPRRRLGLEDARPLPRTVSNFIYRLEEHCCHRASEILKRWLPVAEHDWATRYGWRPVHWETMVGQGDKVLGACFRSLGWTTGRSARRPAGHTHSKRIWMDAPPKLVFYRGPLARLAR